MATSFLPSIIPFSATEIQNPMRGIYDWNLTQEANPSYVMPQPTRDIYVRDALAWSDMETSLGVYNLDLLETYAALAASRGGRFGFRFALMLMGRQRVPSYIINNQGTYGGFGSGGDYTPDFDNSAFLARVEAFYVAIGARVGNDKRFGFCDIGIYGSWGEWHTWGSALDHNVAHATLANFKRIIDAHLNGCPKFQWIFNYGSSLVSDACAYAMTRQTTAGLWVGWRNDSLGSTTNGNAHTYSACWLGGTAPQQDQWKRAPVVGELGGMHANGTTDTGPGTFADVLAQVNLYHYSLVGNSNTWDSYSSSPLDQQQNWIDAGKKSGYRIELRSVTVPNVIEAGSHATFRAEWINVGVAPPCQSWPVKYELRSTSGLVVWTGVSTLDLMGLLPATGTTVVNENFNMPADLAIGTHSLCVHLADPSGYSAALALAINGRDTRGAYPIGSITVPH